MLVVLLAGRLIGMEERRHGTLFGCWLAFGAMVKPPLLISSSQGG
jgi:hypothetical protein